MFITIYFGNCFSEHAEKFGFGVVDRFVGHGVGTVFHSEPVIYHHREYPLDSNYSVWSTGIPHLPNFCCITIYVEIFVFLRKHFLKCSGVEDSSGPCG